MDGGLRFLYSAIEGREAFAAVSIASGMEMFKEIVQGISSALTLMKLLDRGDSKELYQGKVALRIGTLLSERHPLEYARPDDTAIAIYLYVLHEVKSEYTKGLAAVIYQMPGLWWARHLAAEILTE